MSGLVLSRKKGERVFAGDVVVTLVEIRGDKARLCFEAPKDIAIHREEVWARICGEQDSPEDSDHSKV